MDNERIARDFMNWYGANMDKLKRYVEDYDEDLFSDAFLRAYNAILRNGTQIENYTGYFLRTYRATFLDSKKRRTVYAVDEANSGCSEYRNLAALEVPVHDEENAEARELAVDGLNTDILKYVEEHYDPFSSSLFEIYLGLFPEVSYVKLSAMLGISEHKIRHRIRPIRQDVAARFCGVLD